MLKKIFLAGYFDYRSFLYDNAYELSLTPNDCLILIYLLDEYLKGNKLIDINQLEEKLLLHKNDINNSLTTLLENSFYNVCLVEADKGLEEQISIEPFFKKVEEFYKEEDPQTNKKIYSLIEKKSKRILSANDYDNITNLIVNENYTYDDFNATISYLEKAKLDISVRNIMKYIEKKIVKIKDTAPNETVNELLNIFRKQNG